MSNRSFRARTAHAAAALALGATLPCAAAAASPAAEGASAPVGPTASARIATKCKAMSGDEKAACERDIRADARHAHSKKTHAKSSARAASATS